MLNMLRLNVGGLDAYGFLASATHTTSTTQIIFGEFKRHKRGMLITLAALVVAATALFFYFNRKPVLTDTDTIRSRISSTRRAMRSLTAHSSKRSRYTSDNPRS